MGKRKHATIFAGSIKEKQIYLLTAKLKTIKRIFCLTYTFIQYFITNASSN